MTQLHMETLRKLLLPSASNALTARIIADVIDKPALDTTERHDASTGASH